MSDNMTVKTTSSSGNTTETKSMESGVLISDEATGILMWTIYLMCEGMAIFGTGANIVNIICFYRQGLKDSVNVSFLGLAVSDLGSVAFLLFSSICFLPGFREADIPFEPVELQFLTTGWGHVTCTRVTSWTTALITLERCLCITMPLKVKNIITPKRVIIIMVGIFLFTICGIAPMYYSSRFAWVFTPHRNRTILTVVYTSDRAIIEQISLSITNVASPFTSFLIVVILTIVLVVQLRRKAKWRLKCTESVKADIMFERDQKVAKMVVMLSGLFIACYIPLCLVFIAMMLEPKISLDGEYKNTLYVIGSVSALLAACNSASNIIIYYHMSSKYRSVCRQLFGRKN